MTLLQPRDRVEYRLEPLFLALSLMVFWSVLPACKGGSSSGESAGPESPTTDVQVPGPESQRPALENPSPENQLRQDLADKLVADLLSAGLNDAQAHAVANHAKKSGSGLRLRSNAPIVTVPGPFVTGAVTALAMPELSGLSNQLQAKTLETIMSSTFGSLKGRTADLQVDEVLALQKEMVVAAVNSVKNGGVGGEKAADSVKAITIGAASAVSASVGSDRAIDALSGIVAGVVESAKTTGIEINQIDKVVGSAVEGTVGQMSAAGLDNDKLAAAASAVAKTSIESLRSLELPPEVVVLASGKAAEGAVAGLIDGGVEASSLAGVAQQVAATSVSALKEVGVAAEDVIRAAGSVASGAISGLAKTGLDASGTEQSGSIAAIVAGASSRLAAAGIPAEQLTNALGDVASKAVSAIASISEDGAIREQALKAVVSGSVRGLSDESFMAVDTIAALAGISQKSVEALPAANLGDLAGKATALVAATAIEQIVASGLTDATKIASMSQKITQSAGTGLATLAKSGRDVSDVGKYMFEETYTVMKAVQGSLGLDATKVSEMVSTSSSATMTGMALAGETSAAASALNTLKTTSTNDAVLSALKISAADETALQAAVTQAAEETVVVSESDLPECQNEFTDGSIEGVRQQIATLRYCRVNSGSPCPFGIKNSIGQLDWKLWKPGVCEFTSSHLFESSSQKSTSTWSSTSTSTSTESKSSSDSTSSSISTSVLNSDVPQEASQPAQTDQGGEMLGSGRRYSSWIVKETGLLRQLLGRVLKSDEAVDVVVSRGFDEAIQGGELEISAFVRGLLNKIKEIPVDNSETAGNQARTRMAEALAVVAQSTHDLLEGSSPYVLPAEYLGVIQQLAKVMMLTAMHEPFAADDYPLFAQSIAKGFMTAAAMWHQWDQTRQLYARRLDLGKVSEAVAQGVMQSFSSLPMIQDSSINIKMIAGAVNFGLMQELNGVDIAHNNEFSSWALQSSKALIDGAKSLNTLDPDQAALQSFIGAIILGADEGVAEAVDMRLAAETIAQYHQTFASDLQTALANYLQSAGAD